MMELRHLRYFVAVAEELHFRRAAERLHIAQPAVSEQIRKLEQELGVRLFNRDKRKVELTTPGSALLVEARRVLRQADVACSVARAAHVSETSHLRIGYLPDALPVSVPRAVRRLAQAGGPLRTTLQTGPALRLLEDVREGCLDAAVVCLPAPARGLRVTELGTVGAVAALPASDPNANRPTIDLRQVAPERLVVLPRAGNPAFYDAIVSTCHAVGTAPTLVEMPDADVAQALLAVAAGEGMAILPDTVVDRFAAPGVRLRPVVNDGLTCQMAVVTRTDVGHTPTAALLRALETSLRTLSVVEPVREMLVAA